MSQFTLLNTNNLLENQILKLLKELQLIYNQKWVMLNSEGLNHMNNLFEIFQTFDDIFEKSAENKINYEIDFLKKCNDINDKLVEVINNFELQIKRVNEIKKILFDLSQQNCIEIINMSKNYIDCISSEFNKDFNLKAALVHSLIFKSRHNRADQVALLSCWMHEPSIELMNVKKFNILINNCNKN
jgi:hypothetical protein